MTRSDETRPNELVNPTFILLKFACSFAECINTERVLYVIPYFKSRNDKIQIWVIIYVKYVLNAHYMVL